jgi:hypothetical protein
MIQRHTILLNQNFSAQTAVVNSSLITLGGYQVNNIQGLGGGIVNSSNVRVFLNNDVNESIINDFFSYLTGSTTTVEFAEIYHSDQKLADVFNNYYVSSVLNNQFPATSVIDNSLTGTTGTTVIENAIYNYGGYAPSKGLDAIPLSINNSTRNLNIYSALTTYTNEQSYYIPVFIRRKSGQINGDKIYFDEFQRVIDAFINPGDAVNSGGTGNTDGGGYYGGGSSEYGTNSYGYGGSGSQGKIALDLGEAPSDLGESIFDQFL